MFLRIRMQKSSLPLTQTITIALYIFSKTNLLVEFDKKKTRNFMLFCAGGLRETY